LPVFFAHKKRLWLFHSRFFIGVFNTKFWNCRGRQDAQNRGIKETDLKKPAWHDPFAGNGCV
jgi:hypothetical protein